MPGVPEEAIEHRGHESVTTLTSDKTRHKRQGETWGASERHDGAFRRSFRLPPVTAAEAAIALVMNSVFQITPRRD
ncbi:Hsp20/alpha crystallin family protein [Salipiger thiooxidans]|uniref:Hsp20/alpha crystallin family protein n=1 Tax=Salipiger thiooxidans TaxID=282683 RepID=UPI001A8D00BD|nr:Hsp20/alpha crystallin family protein [Salipiger thiooxidans]